MESEEMKYNIDASQECLAVSGNQVLSKHPLLIPEILREVLKYASKTSLLKCRIVCQTWHEEATFHLRKLPSTIITLPLKESSSQEEEETYLVEKMKMLKTCIDQSWNWPVTKLKYCGVPQYYNTYYELRPTLTSALRSISPLITELTLEPILEAMRVSFYKTEFSALKKLWLIFDYNINKTFGALVHPVLRSAPDLQAIDITDTSFNYNGKTNFFLLRAIKLSKLKNLNQLSINGGIYNSHLLQIGEMGLQIKVLELVFSKIEENFGSNLYTMLTKLAGSLVELQLLFPQNEQILQEFRLSFPKLENLEKLELNSIRFDLPLPQLSFGGFSYAEKMPNLKVLEADTRDMLSFLAKPCETLQKLYISGSGACKILIGGLNMFPNVKSLQVRLSQVNRVCVYWTHLEQLELKVRLYEDNMNQVLTGLERGKWQEYKTRYENGESFEIIEREMLSGEMGHTLVNCKKLKVLKLNCYPKGLSVNMSGLVCELILMKMESLECLDFCGSLLSSVKISAELLDRMRKKFKLIC